MACLLSVQGIDRVNIFIRVWQLEQQRPHKLSQTRSVNAVLLEASQLALIGAVEQHFGVEKVALAKAVALILKTFYDEDIITEDVLISWYDGPKSEFSPSSVDDEALAFVKGKAEVFINWMKEAVMIQMIQIQIRTIQTRASKCRRLLF